MIEKGEDLLAAGDQVAVRWTATGTHTGTLLGIPPTGKHVTAPGISIFRVAGDKIEEGQTVYDALGTLQQLGVIPPPEPAG
jgi:predicted ester cyclase